MSSQTVSLERMGREPMLKLIISFTLPSIAGMLANSLYNIVDRIFVGRVVGTLGLGAISVAFPFMIFLLSMCMLLGVGAVPLISGSLGEGRHDRAERILTNVVAAAIVSGFALAVLGFVFMDPILKLSGASETILEPSREYMRIILLGTPFNVMCFVMNFSVRAEGRPNFAMSTQLLGTFTNIILDALFVWGLDWGIAGAAWATIISQFLGFLWVSSFYLRRRGALRLYLSKPEYWLPRRDLLGRVAMLGIPPAVTELSFSIFFVFFNRALAQYSGPVAVSALGAFMGWDSLLFLPVVGIAEGVQAIFGFNYGARRPMRVITALKLALILATIYFVGSAIVVKLFISQMMGLFSSDPELLEIATEGGKVAYTGVVFSGVGLISNSFFQGLNLAGLSLFLTLLRQFGFLLPALLIMPKFFGAIGVWASYAVLDIASASTSIVCLLYQCHRRGLLQTEARWVRLRKLHKHVNSQVSGDKQ